MKIPSYEQAYAQLVSYARSNGLKLTRQRSDILRTFLSTGKHVGVEELLRRVRRRNPGVGHATVYRTMKVFVEAGLAAERHFADGVTTWEPTGGDEAEHHDHLICVACGAIVEFTDDRIEGLQDEVAAAHGFELTQHRLELYGRCADCRAS